MIILRSHTRAFGGLQEVTLEFDERINLIHAANEGGKSTLQRFIIAMLYGQLRADISTQRRLDPWVELLAPWNAPEYGGSLFLRFADGREVEIHRSFGR
ncbi:MAG: AAA family ATPase [Acidobacteriota bacterium]